MNQNKLNLLAVEIIRSNIYLTLATTDGNLPWASPVFYCIDENYNFYFISQPDSTHIKNIIKNPQVSFAIFDSYQAEGEGNGVQGSGRVELLEGEKLLEGLNYYSTTFIELTPESLSSSQYQLFKLKSDKFYVLDPDGIGDKRVEVFVRS